VTIGLSPQEFWSLTPWEFECAVHGATERRHYEQETVAKMTANLMNVQLSRADRVSPDDIYRRPDAPPEFTDPEAFKVYMRARQRETEEQSDE
jgi:hypothetical protein